MNTFPPLENCTIAVIGLGYVGLPLAVAFSSNDRCLSTNARLRRRVIGFDISTKRLSELIENLDVTNEVKPYILQNSANIKYTNKISDLTCADVFIITVPTPIDKSNRPDMSSLQRASETVGKALLARTNSCHPVIIYESTVYPGATEEVCVPILESCSESKFNKDFFVGYSPERINPGDQEHTLSNVIKVTSGSNDETAKFVDKLYSSIISAGTYPAPSIIVAEAAKVIENTQRDLNIALINELSIIFSHMNIDTLDVLKAASTKWNFIDLRPGLVGGHCIGVDPYYLTYKSELLGYHPQVVLAGRRINDGMARWLSDKLVLAIASRQVSLVSVRILMLGFAFKENCPDIRNTKVIGMVSRLLSFGFHVDVVDPYIDQQEALQEYGLHIYNEIPKDMCYEAIVAAVAHQPFIEFSESDWTDHLVANGVLFDIKGIIPRTLDPLRM